VRNGTFLLVNPIGFVVTSGYHYPNCRGLQIFGAECREVKTQQKASPPPLDSPSATAPHMLDAP